VITSEELRVGALAASAKRGKWVARRRIFRRWLGWVTWRYVLPVIGLLTVLTAFMGFAFWQFMGHDVAYAEAQKWVQKEFGSFQVNLPNNVDNKLAPTKSANNSLIPLTGEAAPDLQIDRHLRTKTTP
jgi:hypothetical protein